MCAGLSLILRNQTVSGSAPLPDVTPIKKRLEQLFLPRDFSRFTIQEHVLTCPTDIYAYMFVEVWVETVLQRSRVPANTQQSAPMYSISAYVEGGLRIYPDWYGIVEPAQRGLGRVGPAGDHDPVHVVDRRLQTNLGVHRHS